MKLDHAITAYINHITQRNYSYRTIESYRSDLKYLTAYFPIRSIDEINIHELRDFQRHLFQQKLSSASQGRVLTVVRMLFKFSAKYDYIPSNPASSLELPREEKRLPKDILSMKDIKKMIEASDKECALQLRNRAIMEVFYATGMRVTELIQLTIYSINESNLTVRIQGKGRKERIVPISGRAMILVRNYIEDLRPMLISRNPQAETVGITLFLSYRGKVLRRADLSLLIQSFAKDAGINTHVTPHIIRHSIATHLLKNGMDIRYIQELLGHEDLRTTERYTKIENKDLQEMVERHHPLP